MTKAELLDKLECELYSGSRDEGPRYIAGFDGAALIHECLEAERDLRARAGKKLGGRETELRRRHLRLVS